MLHHWQYGNIEISTICSAVMNATTLAIFFSCRKTNVIMWRIKSSKADQDIA